MEYLLSKGLVNSETYLPDTKSFHIGISKQTVQHKIIAPAVLVHTPNTNTAPIDWIV